VQHHPTTCPYTRTTSSTSSVQSSLSHLSRLPSNLLLGLLDGTLGGVGNSLDRVRGLVLQFLSSLDGTALLAALPQEDTGDLDGTNASKEEVNGGKPMI